MRFLDPTSREIYPANQLADLIHRFCRHHNCYDCPLHIAAKDARCIYCFDFAHRHPAYAARLMGYELLTDENPADTPKPPTPPDRHQYMSIAEVNIAGLPTVMTYCCTRKYYESLSEKDPTIPYRLNDDGTIYLGDT